VFIDLMMHLRADGFELHSIDTIVHTEDRRLSFQKENKILQLASLLSSRVVVIVGALCHLWTCLETPLRRASKRKRKRILLQPIVTITIISNQETIMFGNDDCYGNNDDDDDDNGWGLI